MEAENQKALMPFLQRVREECPDKDVWLYSGYVYEEIKDSELLQYVNVLVDGPFVEELKDPSLAFRGSRNQRILNVPESLRAGHAVLEDSSRWDTLRC